MLKKAITFEDFDGNTVTDTHYFHITKSELIELEVEYEGGLSETIERISKEEDSKQIVAIFKRLVLLAHGQKSADGKSFIKSEADRIAFSQTAAYDVVFMELATDDKAAAEFLKGIMPADLGAEIEKLEQLAAAEVAQKAQEKAAEIMAAPAPQTDASLATPPPYDASTQA